MQAQDSFTPFVAAVKGSISITKCEQCLLDFRRLHRRADVEYVPEEMWVALIGWHFCDGASELGRMISEWQHNKPAFQMPTLMKNPRAFLGLLDNVINSGLHEAERDG